jgi:integrase/recombinase XerD
MAMPRPLESATYQLGHAVGYDPDANLDELFEEFIEDSASFINARTEVTYRRDYERFQRWLVDEAIAVSAAALDRPVLVRYIRYLEARPNLKPGHGRRERLSRHTLHTYLRPIRTFARYLVENGRLPRDPLWGARSPMPRPGPRISKAATEDDVACLDRGTRGRDPVVLRDRVLFLLALDDGCRTSEIVNLRMGDIHLDDLYWEIHRAKGDASRVVPFSRETAAAIKRYLRLARPALTGVAAQSVGSHELVIVGRGGRPLTANGAYQAISRAFRRGGGSGPMGLHRLRHLFARHSQEAGGDARIVQDILGHSDAKTTRGYAGSSSVVKRKAIHAAVSPIRLLSRRGR